MHTIWPISFAPMISGAHKNPIRENRFQRESDPLSVTNQKFHTDNLCSFYRYRDSSPQVGLNPSLNGIPVAIDYQPQYANYDPCSVLQSLVLPIPCIHEGISNLQLYSGRASLVTQFRAGEIPFTNTHAAIWIHRSRQQ